MATTTILSEEEYHELAFNDPNHLWELWDGVLVEKPLMSMLHDDVATYTGSALIVQLDRSAYRVNVNGARARYAARNYVTPDVAVIPAHDKTPTEGDPRAFNAFDEPLPLVVEVWSWTTGDYDVAAKLLLYQARGDREIWCVRPYERTLTVWRRQADGSYSEGLYRGGIVPVLPFPGVELDFDALLGG